MKPAETLVVLPGLDGTEVFFRPFLGLLPDWICPLFVCYPPTSADNYDDLFRLVREKVAGLSPYFVLGSSFSGPLAAMLAAAEPERVRGVILSATFLRTPRPSLSRLRFAVTGPVFRAFRAARRIPIWTLRNGDDPFRVAKTETWRRVSARCLAARSRAALGERIGGRILKVGVGTGLSLPYYSPGNRVIGIDLSEHMLEKARARVVKERLSHVEDLAIMDAEDLDYADESFDVVTAQCVVNTVLHPEKALDEFARVLKPGGEIVLLNRIGADAGPRLAFEHLFQPVANRFGWRSDFPWSLFDSWLAASKFEMHLIERQPVPPSGHFSVIRFGKSPASVAVDHAPQPQLLH